MFTDMIDEALTKFGESKRYLVLTLDKIDFVGLKHFSWQAVIGAT